MVILGIDPGLATTGYGLVQPLGGIRFRHIAHGTLRTEKGLPLADRLLLVYQQCTQLLDAHAPAEAAVESLFFTKNARTAFAVGQARGALLISLASRGIPIHEYTPLQVKQAVVGYGKATKAQVQKMVTSILRLPKPPRPDDAADALALALCHCFGLGQRRAVRRAVRRPAVRGQKSHLE